MRVLNLMRTVTRTIGSTCILGFAAPLDLDAENAPELRKRIRDTHDRGCRGLVIDLEAVGFVDSSGLGVLISGLKLFARDRGRFALSGVGEELASILRVTRLDRVFDVYPDAVAAAKGLEGETDADRSDPVVWAD